MRLHIAGLGAGRAGRALAIALAGLMGSAQTASLATTKLAEQIKVMKATREYRKNNEAININAYGGLDFPTQYTNDFGMSPMQYGLLYGSGKSRNKKSNRKRLSHNAKLKRRRAK